jgi:hypothetical protein
MVGMKWLQAKGCGCFPLSDAGLRFALRGGEGVLQEGIAGAQKAIAGLLVSVFY